MKSTKFLAISTLILLCLSVNAQTKVPEPSSLIGNTCIIYQGTHQVLVPKQAEGNKANPNLQSLPQQFWQCPINTKQNRYSNNQRNKKTSKNIKKSQQGYLLPFTLPKTEML